MPSNALPRDYVLGEYHLASVLGEGAFGITYRAEDRNLNCFVAIKEYLPSQLARRREDGVVIALGPDHAGPFTDWKSRFLDEARTLARFRHRNIVRVLRFFEANDTAYLVMELEQGITLEQYLASLGRPPTQAEIDAVLLPLLDGLDVVHAGGFLHRDLKPQNIMIRTDGSPVLIDFGAARQEVEGRSRTLTSIYTPGYAAPEQYAGHGRLGPWTDIFAMGAVLYRAVSGAKPMDSLSRLMSPDDPLPPAAVAAKAAYRPGFLAAIDAALRVKPDERPQSVAAWRTLLVAEMAVAPQPVLAAAVAVAGAPDLCDAPTVVEPPPAPPPFPVAEAAEPAALPVPPPAPPPRRGWRPWAAVAVVLVAAGAAWVVLEPGGTPPPAAAPPSAAPPAEPVPAVAEPVLPAAPAEPAKEIEAAATPATTAPLRDCPDCPELVVIPAGSFLMGSPPSEPRRRDREGPQQPVTIAAAFAMSRAPVTRSEFEIFATETGHAAKGCSVHRRAGWFMDAKADWRSPGFDQDGRHPVVCLSFADAQAYAEWLSRKTGKAYRLPSEAEWEYAARAGTAGSRPWGEASQCAHANAADQSTRPLHPLLLVADCDDGFPYTAPVGSFPANAFGLVDMLGNVAQWTRDCWNPTLAGLPQDGTPRGDDRCPRRVVRGTGWTDGPDDVRVAVRYNGEAQRREVTVGLRVVRPAEP